MPRSAILPHSDATTTIHVTVRGEAMFGVRSEFGVVSRKYVLRENPIRRAPYFSMLEFKLAGAACKNAKESSEWLKELDAIGGLSA